MDDARKYSVYCFFVVVVYFDAPFIFEFLSGAIFKRVESFDFFYLFAEVVEIFYCFYVFGFHILVILLGECYFFFYYLLKNKLISFCV